MNLGHSEAAFCCWSLNRIICSPESIENLLLVDVPLENFLSVLNGDDLDSTVGVPDGAVPSTLLLEGKAPHGGAIGAFAVEELLEFVSTSVD